MNSKQLKIARKQMAIENKRWPKDPISLPVSSWPKVDEPNGDARFAVYRSSDFLIQLFHVKSPSQAMVRMTVNRTTLGMDGDWKGDITWDELQALKHWIGYGDLWAIEIYPPADSTVDVANMRHLWLLYEAPDFGWK